MQLQTRELLVKTLGQGLTEHISKKSEDLSRWAYSCLEELLLSMDKASDGRMHDVFLDNVAKAAIASLLQVSGRRSDPEKEASAAKCLAALIRRFGSPQTQGKFLCGFIIIFEDQLLLLPY